MIVIVGTERFRYEHLLNGKTYLGVVESRRFDTLFYLLKRKMSCRLSPNTIFKIQISEAVINVGGIITNAGVFV